MKRLDTIERQIQRLEREKAEWHQAHRDDHVTDGVAVAPRTMQTVFSIRLDPELIGRLRDLADFYGCTTSDVARRLLADAWLPAVQVGPVRLSESSQQ